MWTLTNFLYLFFVTFLPTVWIVRFLEPFLWSFYKIPEHILIIATSDRKIDIYIYTCALIIFCIIWSINSVLYLFLKKRTTWFSQVVTLIAATGVCYFLFVAPSNLFFADQLHAAIIPIFLFFFVLCVVLQRTIPTSWMEVGVGLILLKYFLPLVFVFDAGANPIELVFFYPLLYFAILILIPVIIIVRRLKLQNAIARQCTKLRMSMVLFSLIVFSLLELMLKSHSGFDMYFTLTPAYQFVHDATPFVNLLSQYGALYLIPWIMWLMLFPSVPVSAVVGTMVTIILLVGYFTLLLSVLGRLIRNVWVFALTVLAICYYTLLIHFWGFADAISLVSMPAFTPLRFGIYIIPLVPLAAYAKSRRSIYFLLFLVMSVILFFYSIEIGISLLCAGIGTAYIHALTRRNERFHCFMRYTYIIIASLLGCVGILSLFTLVRTHQFPQMSLYTYFARMFGNGFLALSMQGQTVVSLIIFIAFLGIASGIFLLAKKDNLRGLIFIYLALIQLTLLPYYMNRSIFPTLYPLASPALVICGMIVDWGIEKYTYVRNNFALVVTVFLCGIIVTFGGTRGLDISFRNLIRGGQIISDSQNFIDAAFHEWEIKKTPQYAFLRKNLPTGCPLASIYAHEQELMASLSVPPAFALSFIFGLMATKEQIDTLQFNAKDGRICFFIDLANLYNKDDLLINVYPYLWNTLAPRATLLTVDGKQGYGLFEIKAP